MRIGPCMKSERIGNVQINELQRVIELDAGFRARESRGSNGGDIVVPADVLATVEEDMIIIIACMNEDYQTIEGVLSGIPHDCLPILVSNSERPGPNRPAVTEDRYAEEVRLLEVFCARARRSAISVHQADAGVAAAFRAGGLSEIVDDEKTGLVRKGKGEAMIIGMAVAALTGRRYVGFIDADNFVPGSVTEYCKVFAAGLHSARSPHAMVRVSWNSKPKVRDGQLSFDKTGRSSRVVNEWLNKLLEEYTGYGTDLIVTGNAGEHAMTMELALQLQLARGYAIEPYEMINILEMFGCEGSFASTSVPALDHDSGHESDSDVEVITPASSLSSSPSSSAASPISHHRPTQKKTTQSHQQQLNSSSSSSSPSSPSSSSSSPTSAAPRLVEILQIETRNPHFHDTTKGEEHVQDMQLQGLNALYHSTLATPELRARLRGYMAEHLNLRLAPGEDPPRERTYPPLASALDFAAFHDVLTSQSASLRQIGLAAEVDVLLADRNTAPAPAPAPRVSSSSSGAVGVSGYRRSNNPRRTKYERVVRDQKILQHSDDDADDDDDNNRGSPRSSSNGWNTAMV